MKINVFDVYAQKLLTKHQVKRLVKRVVIGENMKSHAQLNVIFTTNKEIQKLNNEYFNKNQVTDVIAFSLEDPEVFGEVYICVEQAIERADEFQATQEEELARLIVHGLLHLAGYVDSDKEGKVLMHEKEDSYLSLMKIGSRGGK